ncbi:Nif3-like dinuclear metal center hexameric protein [Natranaeroarchaeum aerophilus]|uniref:Nif3-like dinuclear metal center hexameric protein n=1 Tax=Natranaeroarchaeum aerophilus TaxID=2917711 RepID=A0AAE3K7X4_9EURY|nr:Nif3-like dinuclear metal center hexameric protein [Natranaeroarchaeum aerophilus]MCL9814394.1 Nif3-like dinuclear metal center hexameric protein [Natranaeroarchaeum aerophilus]
MQLSELVERYDERLDTDAYADVDASANGLQVGPEEATVEHVAVAVDAGVATIERAADAGADVLVTHHGVVFGGIDHVTGPDYDRIEALIENDIALYVSHLPLDGHQELGNAAGIADLLQLTDREPFGTIGGEYIGQRGRRSEPLPVEDVAETLNASLDTGGRDVQTFAFGPEEVEDVAIVTGSGVDWLEDAADTGADVLVTGEGKQHAYHLARELGINLVLAGHYATETFGVRNLQSLAEEWGLETTFIDEPTGL